MTGYSVIMGPQGCNEYASGGRDVAQEGFLRHLRTLPSSVRKNIEDSYAQSSNLDDLRIRTARVLQDIVDSDIKASSLPRPGIPTARRVLEEILGSNLRFHTLQDAKIYAARVQQRMVDRDVRASKVHDSPRPRTSPRLRALRFRRARVLLEIADLEASRRGA